jgi:hypothetical protein
MDEKKIIHQIILDIWNLVKKYVFTDLDDKGWEDFINEAIELSKNYKNHDDATRRLFSDVFFAFERYKTSKEGARK